MHAEQPGQLVRMDHMSVSFPGATIKNFTAVCPATGYLVAHAYSRATSRNAARFLDHVLHTMPFAITALQVDGGSQFRGAFEQACQARGIAPYVLPPQNPQNNAGVERAHRSLRQKFYRHDCNLLSLNPALHAFQHHYRHYRPHTGKRQNMLTPMAYYQSLKEAA